MAFHTFGERASPTLQPHAQISGNAEKGIAASAARSRKPGKPAWMRSGSSQGREDEQEFTRQTQEEKVPCKGTEVCKTLLLLTLCSEGRGDGMEVGRWVW